jgi:hypothetical protein
MSSHHDHDDQHVSENKPVPFVVPMILGLVTMLVILLFVSLDNPSKCCEGGECKKEAVSGHEAEAPHDHTSAAAEEAHENKALEEPDQTHANTPKDETGEQEETGRR